MVSNYPSLAVTNSASSLLLSATACRKPSNEDVFYLLKSILEPVIIWRCDSSLSGSDSSDKAETNTDDDDDDDGDDDVQW